MAAPERGESGGGDPECSAIAVATTTPRITLHDHGERENIVSLATQPLEPRADTSAIMDPIDRQKLVNGVHVTRQRSSTSATPTKTVIALEGSKLCNAWFVASFFPIALGIFGYAWYADSLERGLALFFGACALAVGLYCLARYLGTLRATIDDTAVIVSHTFFTQFRVLRADVDAIHRKHDGPHGEHELSTLEVVLIERGKHRKIIKASNYGNLDAVEEFARVLADELTIFGKCQENEIA